MSRISKIIPSPIGKYTAIKLNRDSLKGAHAEQFCKNFGRLS